MQEATPNWGPPGNLGATCPNLAFVTLLQSSSQGFVEMANYTRILVAGLLAMMAFVFTIIGIIIAVKFQVAHPKKGAQNPHHTSFGRAMKNVPGNINFQSILRHSEKLNVKLRGFPTSKTTTVGSSVALDTFPFNYTNGG